MAEADREVCPIRNEGSCPIAEKLDRIDESTVSRHARQSWRTIRHRDATLGLSHWTKESEKKRLSRSATWTDKSEDQMDQVIWTGTTSGPSVGVDSGEDVVIMDSPKSVPSTGNAVDGEFNFISTKSDRDSASGGDDDDYSPMEPDGEEIDRSPTPSSSLSGSSSWTLHHEHVVNQGEIISRYVDELESISWDQEHTSVMGMLVDMMTTVNHHMYSVGETTGGVLHQEHATLQEQIRQEKAQIKNLVQELFGQHPDGDLADRLLFQLDQ